MPMSDRYLDLERATRDDLPDNNRAARQDVGFSAFGSVPAKAGDAAQQQQQQLPQLPGPAAAAGPGARPGAAPSAADTAAWRRWKMVSLDPRDKLPPQLPMTPEEPAPPPIDYAALDALRETARKEGYALGYTQGQTQGYGDGHKEGYARGLEAARAEATQLHAIAQSFQGALTRIDAEVSQTLVSLALDVARRIVQQTVSVDPTSLLPAVRELLAHEPPLAGSPSLMLNPEDVALVNTHLKGELEQAGWNVRADASIARGGCVASAASGELDATLSTRWQRVVKALGRDDAWEAPHD